MGAAVAPDASIRKLERKRALAHVLGAVVAGGRGATLALAGVRDAGSWVGPKTSLKGQVSSLRNECIWRKLLTSQYILQKSVVGQNI